MSTRIENPGAALAGLKSSRLKALTRALVTVLLASCATPPIGRGGPVYDVIVDTINGRHTGTKGPAGYPAATLQVGSEVQRVWLGHRGRSQSPPLMRADAEALKEGIMIELDWHTAVLHRVTDHELAVGAAVVYIPRAPERVVVELRFRPVSKMAVKTP